MGVTLERVQNKFACIIGELCNEPDILSQFAIWVDLRIAEYKSKGAISLDCSGENPNPTWLRGFRPLTKERTADNNVPFSRPSNFTNRDSSLSPGHQQLWDQRISSDNGASNSFHRGGVSRKRPSSDFTSSYLSHSDNTISSAKRFNSSDFSQSIIEPTNESLMSIIGADQEPEIIETTTRENADSSEITIVLDNDETDHNLTPPTFTSAPGEITLSEDRGGNSSQTSGCRYGQDSGTFRENVLRTMASSGQNQYLHQRHYPYILRGSSIRQRIPRSEEKTPQTVNHLVSAVSVLERWWWLKYNELRPIETMPPEILNDYLKEFFTVLVKPDGTDYEPAHLMKVRSYLERFLRELGYATSLSKSPEFRSSQLAMRTKRHSIMIKRAQQTENRVLSDGNVESGLLFEL